MVEKEDNENIVHYSSRRCRKVTRIVMESKLYALILAFDHGFFISNLPHDSLGNTVNIEAMVDSRIVFNVVVKHGKKAENRLQIDITRCYRDTKKESSN